MIIVTMVVVVETEYNLGGDRIWTKLVVAVVVVLVVVVVTVVATIQ